MDISMDISGTVVLLDRATLDLEILLLLFLMLVGTVCGTALSRVSRAPSVVPPVVWPGGGRL